MVSSFFVLHFLFIFNQHSYNIIVMVLSNHTVADQRFALHSEIAVTQGIVGEVMASTSSSRTRSAPTAPTSVASAGKRPIPVITLDSSPASSLTASTFGSSASKPSANNGGYSHFAPVANVTKRARQTKIWEPPCDPKATMEMDVAIADLVHSNLYKFNFAEDAKFQRVLDIARRLPPNYKPPSAHIVGGVLLSKLYDVNWNLETASLLADAHTFGISVYGDGATIKTVPMINALGAGVNNSFAMLDVFDCTDHCAEGGKKDAVFIAGKFLGVIDKIEAMVDIHVSSFIVLYTSCEFLSNLITVAFIVATG